jgi:hypothetical protein
MSKKEYDKASFEANVKKDSYVCISKIKKI